MEKKEYSNNDLLMLNDVDFEKLFFKWVSVELKKQIEIKNSREFGNIFTGYFIALQRAHYGSNLPFILFFVLEEKSKIINQKFELNNSTSIDLGNIERIILKDI